ncbi:hypothetical protein MMC34_005120 [Xylographa carneopallida]|nr:hypothetical protein [Xylographa carneopallida]
MASSLDANDGSPRKSEDQSTVTAEASLPNNQGDSQPLLQTRILPIDISKIGQVHFTHNSTSPLEDLTVTLDPTSPDAARLQEAARHLRETNVPVAFPTETVYGLGADATCSAAVRGIYAAKRRPLDNPLIVHVCSLRQLRSLLQSGPSIADPATPEQTHPLSDPIPAIYHPLIQRFWPGPLTILLPCPSPPVLAPEVTAQLPTFGARMPYSPLALALIHTAGVPLAAPSANASTRPSPTTAQHVAHDLAGRVALILDGGPCAVGVESTVVDGLARPPAVLRPGGVSLAQIRACPGWEGTVVAYKDGVDADAGSGAPRAPGMKYKHYSPTARVILVEAGAGHSVPPSLVQAYVAPGASRIGVLRTKRWRALSVSEPIADTPAPLPTSGHIHPNHPSPPAPTASRSTLRLVAPGSATLAGEIEVWDIPLGESAPAIARALFAGLRELDSCGVDVIFVEGIDEAEGDEAAAVMNRLRKAAEVEVRGGGLGWGAEELY